MNNRAFAFDCINRLLQAEKLNDATIQILVDGAECKRLFNCVRNSAVLKEVPSNTTEEDLTALCKDGTCQPRYYREKVTVAGRTFLITNYWYGPNTRMPDNRTPFSAWVDSII